MVKTGLVVEANNGLFSKEKVAKETAIDRVLTEKQKGKEVENIEKQNAQSEQKNPFDAMREIAIEFMDMAKKMNSMASDIDAHIADVEKQMAANELDTSKLKQLQTLLKSLG